MPLPQFDTEESIPEPFRPIYEKKADGKFGPKETEVPDVKALRDTLDKERTARETLEREKKDAAKEVARLQREREAREKGISEEELQKIKDAEAAARKPIEDELERTRAENRQLKLNDRVQALAAKYGVMGERQDDALVLLGLKPAKPRADLTDAGGIVVLDKNGGVTTESIEDFLNKTFKTEKPYLYQGTGSSGSGSSGSEGGGDINALASMVALGKKDAAEQKRTASENALAFK